MYVGDFGGEPVFYDPTKGIVTCKNVYAYLQAIISFRDSGKISARLDSETRIIRRKNTYKIGCLEDSHEVFEALISKCLETNE